MTNKKIILASKSPRRQQLMQEMGLEFETRLREVEEIYPNNLPAEDVAEYLAVLKSTAFEDLAADEVLITSDTTVVLGELVLGKPKDEQEAFDMIKSMVGRSHDVISGVCIKSTEKQVSFSVTTKVFFKSITDEQIRFYIDKYQPMDKAGAYGIQEWIGQVGIDKIEGSYFNVVGLPTAEVYEALDQF